MKKILLFSFIISLVIMAFKCNGKSSLDFEEVKFNTPEMVITELGIKNLPKFSYVGNAVNSEFNWDYWDCLVEFQFEDSLSVKEKEAIIKYTKKQDKFQWNLPENGVAEYFNIIYGENDTIPYNIAITNDKVYVAYDNKVYFPDFSDIFSSKDYRLLAERTWLIGPDSSHEYVIKFNKPYSHYINELRKDDTIEYTETGNSITIEKKNGDSTCEIEINKKKNTALILINYF